MPWRNSVLKSEMFLPEEPFHLASTLLCNRCRVLRQTVRFPFSCLSLQVLPSSSLQSRHIHPAFARFRQWPLRQWHEQYALPAIKIPPFLETNGCASPNEQHWPIDSPRLVDPGTIQSNPYMYSR